MKRKHVFIGILIGILTTALLAFGSEGSKTTDETIEILKSRIDNLEKIIESNSYTVNDTIPYNLVPPDCVWTSNTCILNDGRIKDMKDQYLSDYIKIDATKQYLRLFVAVIKKELENGQYIHHTVVPFDKRFWCFFDANKDVVPSISTTSDNVKVIPPTARYVRVTCAKADALPYAVLTYATSATEPTKTIGVFNHIETPQKEYFSANTGFEGFSIVFFGDSITHGDVTGNNDGYSYTDYVSQILHLNRYNVGFGSTTAARVRNKGNGLFCFPTLVDCICGDKEWTDLDAWAASESGNRTFAPHLERLKSINWNDINAISILYGANDWAGDVQIGNEYNEDPENFDGGLAYGIKKMLTKYPHLQVIVFKPWFRARTVNETKTLSDTKNKAGYNMDDYGNAIEKLQPVLHIPVVNSNNWGINRYNYSFILVDGTHPLTNTAKNRLGNLFANAIKTNLSPK